jgi:uroporphyrin-III C-methyltransferase
MSKPAAQTAPRVWLVGAGPGDPELLTLKALRIIRQASVILVDDLVGRAVLPTALQGLPAPPRIVRVGKRGGRASTDQGFINRLLLREALAGERVVRLKGGDPLVFGRAGEEIDALRERGVQVEVVNGISSGLAAAAALGASWTDRRHAQGVLLVTGQGRPGGAGPDWDAIGAVAASGVTLVVYMAVGALSQISAALARHLSGDTPAAWVQQASSAAERRVVSTLAGMAQAAEQQGIASPAVLIIGNVLRGVQALAEGSAEPAQHAVPLR